MEEDLDEKDMMILKHLASGYRSLKGLEDRIPKSTFYRRVKRLIGLGLVKKDGKAYQITEAGRRILDGPRTDGDERDDLSKNSFPFEEHAPTDVHIAVVRITIAAIVARKYSVSMEHHPTIVLLGHTLKFKTWTAKFICRILGLDEAKHIILVSTESGKSLLLRRGYAGKVVSKREVLDFPFVTLDEYQKADAATKRIGSVYTQGRKRLSLENEILEVNPVPMIIMNPISGPGLREATGFDDAELRRMIVCDFSSCDIPESKRTSGEEMLELAKKYAPLKLPPPTVLPKDIRKDSFKVFEACLTTEAMNLLDLDMVSLLVSGMSSLLPLREAIIRVVEDFLTISETVGHNRADWRNRFREWASQVKAPTEGPALLSEAVAADRDAHTDMKLMGEPEKSEDWMNRYDYDRKVRAIKESIESNGLTIDGFYDLLNTHKDVFKNPESLDFAESVRRFSRKAKSDLLKDPDKAMEFLSEVDSRQAVLEKLEKKEDSLRKTVARLKRQSSNLRKDIRQLKMTKSDMESLTKMRDCIEEQGWPMEMLDALPTYYASVILLGLDHRGLVALAREIEATGMEFPEAAKKLASMMKEDIMLSEKLKRERKEMRELRKENKRLRRENDDLKREREVTLAEQKKELENLERRKEVILEKIGERIQKSIELKKRDNRIRLFCPGCQRSFYDTPFPPRELANWAHNGTTVLVDCSFCRTENAYKPSALLSELGHMVLPENSGNSRGNEPHESEESDLSLTFFVKRIGGKIVPRILVKKR